MSVIIFIIESGIEYGSFAEGPSEAETVERIAKMYSSICLDTDEA